MSPVIILGVISQHAEEAAMLWLLRGAATKSPHYSLADLAKIDGRVEAHLDGLRVAGDEGWKFCEEQLAAKESDEVFAAGIMAFESAVPERVAKVFSVVDEEPETVDGLVSALGWLTFEQAQRHVHDLLSSDKPVCQRVGIAAAAIHRRHPGEVLGKFLRSENFGVRARALKAVGEFGDGNFKANVEAALRDADADCRLAAAWSGCLLGVPAAATALREIADSGSGRTSVAASLALRRMDPAAAQSWQKRLAGDPKRIRLAILAAGVIGDASFVPWLISLMGQLPLARLAGEAFTMITGVDLAYRDLERKPPEDFHAGPTEDPKDENVEMDQDDSLPWPEPTLVQKWWEKNRGQFQSGTRYLLGKPMSVDWLKTVLRDGRQRQRAAAAIELAIRQPGQPLFNVAAPGFRQQQILGKGEVIR
jgi:uncharacterized protein (TIGR02270 family)